jgi:hypothetical protein
MLITLANQKLFNMCKNKTKPAVQPSFYPCLSATHKRIESGEKIWLMIERANDNGNFNWMNTLLTIIKGRFSSSNVIGCALRSQAVLALPKCVPSPPCASEQCCLFTRLDKNEHSSVSRVYMMHAWKEHSIKLCALSLAQPPRGPVYVSVGQMGRAKFRSVRLWDGTMAAVACARARQHQSHVVRCCASSRPHRLRNSGSVVCEISWEIHVCASVER